MIYSVKIDRHREVIEMRVDEYFISQLPIKLTNILELYWLAKKAQEHFDMLVLPIDVMTLRSGFHCEKYLWWNGVIEYYTPDQAIPYHRRYDGIPEMKVLFEEDWSQIATEIANIDTVKMVQEIFQIATRDLYLLVIFDTTRHLKNFLQFAHLAGYRLNLDYNENHEPKLSKTRVSAVSLCKYNSGTYSGGGNININIDTRAHSRYLGFTSFSWHINDFCDLMNIGL
jgi:hypothetical protein